MVTVDCCDAICCAAHVYEALYECRRAKSKQHQAGFRPLARKLDKLLTELEGRLTRASLALHQQHWVMFTVLAAYLCRRQCFEAMCDEQRLPHVSALASVTCPSWLGVCSIVLCVVSCVVDSAL